MVVVVCYPRANYTRTNTNSIFDGLLCPEFRSGALVHCRIFSRGSLGVYCGVLRGYLLHAGCADAVGHCYTDRAFIPRIAVFDATMRGVTRVLI